MKKGKIDLILQIVNLMTKEDDNVHQGVPVFLPKMIQYQELTNHMGLHPILIHYVPVPATYWNGMLMSIPSCSGGI